MAVTPGGQAWAIDTARAFDGVAGDYHRTNTANPILQHMRGRSMAMLRRYVPAGADLIDLGCGPGTDHAAMMNAGYVVTGIDASPEMVREAQVRAARLQGPHRPVVICRSIDHVATFPPGSFDAAFSNFGPLNCVDDLAGLEDGGGLDALEGGTVWMRYVSPGAFMRVFGTAGFRLRALEGLGVVAPPPYLEGFAARRPELVARLLAVDEAVGGWPVLRAMGDHFLVAVQRT